MCHQQFEVSTCAVAMCKNEPSSHKIRRLLGREGGLERVRVRAVLAREGSAAAETRERDIRDVV